LFAKIKQQARHLKSETFALYFAARDHRTPWYAKLLVAVIVAYALSPIDLIPDFLPVIGYLDDLILIPLGIAIAIKLIPRSVLDDCRIRALKTINNEKPVSWFAGFVIVLIWLALIALCILWFYET
jgi:uncharacterized membrane protein YkvA (DUF1232 family)